jgi:GYF domain 2
MKHRLKRSDSLDLKSRFSSRDVLWQTPRMTWFYNNEGAADGPHDESSMMSYVSAGKVSALTLVWHNGLDLWQEAGTLNPLWWQPVMEKPQTKASGSVTSSVQGTHRSPVPLAPTEAPEKRKVGLLKRLFGRKE